MQFISLKLITGEVIACGIDEPLNDETLITKKFVKLDKPVLFSSFKFVDNTGQVIETVSMSPFNPVSTDISYTLKTNCIMSVNSIKPSALEKYNQYKEIMHIDRKDVPYLSLELNSEPEPEEDNFLNYVHPIKGSKLH